MSDYKRKTDQIDWADYQKKYFDALMSFNATPSSFNKPGSIEDSFWNNAMEHWWKTMKINSGTSFENKNLFEKIVEQSRNYYFMSEQFSNLIEGISKYNNRKNDVTDFVNDKFEDLKSMFLETSNNLKETSENLSWGKFIDEVNWADFQKKYFDAYESPFEKLSSTASDNINNFANMFAGGINPDMEKLRDQILSIPSVGQNRETQDKFQNLIKLGAVYQDYSNQNQIAMTQLSQDALELMRKEILRMNDKGEELSSMRQIYDLWVESNELVYNEHVHTKEYSELNGKLVNSRMAFMKLSQEINEDIFSSLNLPTTRAMNELERRHYELRKKVNVLESELKALKEKSDNKNTVTESRSRSANMIATKKKKAKTSRKKVTKSAKKKPANKVTKPVKKKTRKKSRSNAANNDVIEIKF
ncbi:MAG: hypothetical protein HND53_04860 [Proteobacteria bacterium]|nr:hypothetical protein [Pseudomonadota bacterium]NOG59810.1 hypothetical protein [Pseudomonadota bacterium]